jgi:hypothetical protein
MSLPQFTAEASCYRSQHTYSNTTVHRSRSTALTAAQEEFACSSQSCNCSGLDDCIDMFGTNVCGPLAACDSTSGLTCTCLRP